MKPVAIFRHSVTEGPGYFADFMDECVIPWKLIRIDAGDAVPKHAGAYAGLVFMGGPMSVNDNLPWIAEVTALIRQAVDQGVPVLGHCLGGQLMAKALGAEVMRNPVKEIGWGQVSVSNNDEAHAWFGDIGEFDAFHWHGETFSLPLGGTHLLSSEHCTNQAFALGKNLALQCHVEMTREMIQQWCKVGVDELSASASSPAVQTADIMQAQMDSKLPQLHAASRRLYQHWIEGLVN